MPPITRLKPMRRKRRLYGAFDSETLGLNGEICLVTWCHELDDGTVSDVYMADTMREFVLWAINYGHDIIWYAHNAEYDWRYLLDDIGQFLPTYTMDVRVRGLDKVYELLFRDKTEKADVVLTMRDSMAVFPSSLKNFAANFSSFGKLDIGLAEGVMFDKTNEKHLEYARRDALVLLECITNYDRLIWEQYGVHISGTVASTSYKAWLRHIPNGYTYSQLGNRECEDFIREGYYGGIVHIRRVNTYFDKVKTFDINSSYPNVMCKYGIPAGRPVYTHRFIPDKEGFYRCNVDATSRDIDAFYFIPKRVGHKESSHIIWARGKFETVISTIEMREAIKRGYKIDVIEGYFFPDMEFPFGEFIDICKMLRREYKGGALEQIAKLLQNALYGKTGMSRDGFEFKVSDDNPEPGKYREDGVLEWQAVTARDCETDQLDEEVPYLYRREVERDAPYMLPHWAAWITACARMELLNIQEHAGNENFLYADTDSVTVLEAGAQRLLASGLVGNEYGQVKDEGYKFDYVVFGPKCYFWRGSDGKVYCKAKGLPRTLLNDQQLMERMHRGERPTLRFVTTKGLIPYMKCGTKQVNSSRRVTDPQNLRSWVLIGTLAVPTEIAA